MYEPGPISDPTARKSIKHPTVEIIFISIDQLRGHFLVFFSFIFTVVKFRLENSERKYLVSMRALSSLLSALESEKLCVVISIPPGWEPICFVFLILPITFLLRELSKLPNDFLE